MAERTTVIQITPTYRLKMDKFCVWLEEKKENNKGENTYYTITGYHMNFTNLLAALCNAKIKNSKAATVEQLISDIEDAETHAVETARAIGNELTKKFGGLKNAD